MRRRGGLLRLAAVSACSLATAACRDSSGPPARLADGSRAVAPAVTLEGVDARVVATKAFVLLRSRVAPGSVAATCLDGSAVDDEGPLVVRVGAYSTSVTFPRRAGRGLIACDGVPDARDDGRKWCGRAFGRLSRGRLRDPRLDLACTDDDGSPIAFAWIQPSRRAAYVVVEQHGYVEAYRVAGGLPVRVANTDVDVGRSSALFVVSEHDREGRLLRAYRLEPRVAG
jgi:hypothetical protein